MRASINDIRQDAIDWARGRVWWVRVPLLLWFLHVFINQLKDPSYASILDGLNLGIHEFGHLIFSFFGEYVHMIGGTITQLLAPLYGVFNFYKQRDYFSIALCFGWLSTSFYDVAIYAADARAQALNLVSPFGGHPLHDWHYILMKHNLLAHDQFIAGGFRFLGILSMLICFTIGGWILYVMAAKKLQPME